MTSDEARELFSAAYDGQLDEAQKREFDAALAADEELASEYRELEALLREASAMGEEGEDAAPDLLAGVQKRIRARSRGRFYRDRFASEAKARSMLPIYLGIAMLLFIGIAWLTLHVVRVEDASHSTAPQTAPVP